MSCPGPRHLGEDGEISAAFRPADTPPELVRGANRTGQPRHRRRRLLVNQR
ncbi:hypothetical protein ACWGQL_24710 [Streptomyces lydicus]|uniref:hypothetical protein n=1 Tax=Streptomyces lydicus TaxID=47763 RepID=UPI0037D47E08